MLFRPRLWIEKASLLAHIVLRRVLSDRLDSPLGLVYGIKQNVSASHFFAAPGEHDDGRWCKAAVQTVMIPENEELRVAKLFD